jgi:ribosomal protein L3 glutamine methyltransferase
VNLREHVLAAAAQLEAAHLSYGHGTTNAFDEAAWLVLWACGLPLDTDISDGSLEANCPVAADTGTKLATLLGARISTRKPAAYLTREAWLQGVPFYVDERAIVPRSLIAECLAEGTIDAWLSDQTHSVLDLCTGNGSLAVLAAMAYPDVQIDAADISPEALAVARINVDKHGLQNRVRLMESNGLQNCAGPYDLILCNPPYVNSTSMGELPAEYRAEPSLALAGGLDGMDFIRPLFAQAAQHMSPHAVLVLEIGNERAHFERAFPTLEVIWLPTSMGDDQVLLVTREALST